jgi:hypothetical protein
MQRCDKPLRVQHVAEFLRELAGDGA